MWSLIGIDVVVLPMHTLQSQSKSIHFFEMKISIFFCEIIFFEEKEREMKIFFLRKKPDLSWGAIRKT